MAQAALGITLAYREGPDRDTGASLLEGLHEASRRKRFTIPGNMPLIEIHLARERGRRGDINGAIELARTVFDTDRQSGGVIWLGVGTAVLVESLLQSRFRCRPAGSASRDLETSCSVD